MSSSQAFLSQISPNIRGIGHQETQAHWHEGPRAIYDCELVIFAELDMEITVGEELIELADPAYVIVQPGLSHEFRALGHRRGHRYYVHFTWNPEDALPEKSVVGADGRNPQVDWYAKVPSYLPRQLFYGSVTNPRYIFGLFMRLYNSFQYGNDHERLVSRARFLELLIELLDGQRRADSAHEGLALAARTRIDQYVEDGARTLQSLSTLFAELEHSYEHICRVFTNTYGVTPSRYLRWTQLHQARRELEETDLPVRDVARTVGFMQANYFASLFKQEFGRTPSQYRLQWRDGTLGPVSDSSASSIEYVDAGV